MLWFTSAYTRDMLGWRRETASRVGESGDEGERCRRVRLRPAGGWSGPRVGGWRYIRRWVVMVVVVRECQNQNPR